MSTRNGRLGASKSLIDDRWAFRLYRRLFGAEDMHSHYRWDAISRYLDLDAASTLEVGGGDGRISFEAVDRGLTGKILLTEFDPVSVEEARRLADAGGYSNVEVSQRDLLSLKEERTFDQVLAVDVLEHIELDEEALREISDVLQPGGQLLVSVPTPRYPHVFGRNFHEGLGHVRDGVLAGGPGAQARSSRAERRAPPLLHRILGLARVPSLLRHARALRGRSALGAPGATVASSHRRAGLA